MTTELDVMEISSTPNIIPVNSHGDDGEDIKVDDEGWQIAPPNQPSSPQYLPNSPNPYAGRTSPTYQPGTPVTPKVVTGTDDGYTLVTPAMWDKFKPKPVKQVLRHEKEVRAAKRAADSEYHRTLKEIQISKEKLEMERESKRAAAFRASRDRLCEVPKGLDRPRREPFRVREVSSITPLTVRVLSDVDSEDDDKPIQFPSLTRTEKDRRAIKQQRASKLKLRKPPPITTRSHKPIKQVSKSEAAQPVATRTAAEFFSPRPETLKPGMGSSQEDIVRGNGSVTRFAKPGSTNLDNNSGRLLKVVMVKYELVGVKFWGFLKSTLSSSLIPNNLGVHVAGDKILVSLPYGLVESLGAFLVGMVPNQETFICCQKFCRMQIRPIDFDTPREMEDAMIYAPYIAMTARAFDREAINRKLSGMIWTKQSLKCLQIGAAASLVLGSLPVAAAATVAGAPVVVGTTLGFCAATACTIAIAAGIKYCHKWFGVDEKPPVYHPTLASSNSKNPTPPQHPKSSIAVSSVVDLVGRSKVIKTPDYVKEDAARVTGLAVEGCEPTVFGINQDNTIKALEKRSCAQPASFDPADRQAFCDWVIKYWDVLVNKPFKIPVPDDPELWYAYVAKWVDGCNSSPHAKKLYLETARSLADQGITAHTILTPEQLHNWTRREVSVKRETVLKDEEKAPRQILNPRPEFVVLTAPFIKDLTGIVKRAWRASKKIVYSPGLSSKSLADCATSRIWDNKVNSDMDSFDLNQGEQTADMETRVCKKYHAPTAHIQLMQANKKGHGFSRLGVKYTSAYVRNTGDPWTTLFNSTLTGTLIAYCFCQSRNVHPSEMDLKVLVGGDDAAFFYDGPRIDFAEALVKLGHPATLDHVDELHRIEFLSCRLTHTSTGWNFVPKAGQMIAKLAYSVRASTTDQARSIARGAALSMYDASSGCPPLRLYLDTIIRITAGVNAIKPHDEPYKLSGMHTGLPTETTWAQLIDVYQYDNLVHKLLEGTLSKVTKSGLIIVSPILKMIIAVDSGRDNFIYPPPLVHENKDGWVEDLTESGIEPNPGPGNKQRMLMVTAGRKSKAERHEDTRMVVHKPPKAKRNNQNRNKAVALFRQQVQPRIRREIGYRRTGGHLTSSGFDMMAYRRVLDNPFDMVPVRLGGETMVPSGLATLVTRFAWNVSTGGFGSLILYPIAGTTIVNVMQSQTANSPYTYTSVAGSGFPGAASLAALSAEGRIVAAGMRIFSTNNSTADSGLVTVGCVPRDVSTASVSISASGFPIAPSSLATQGYNEFNAYLSTETYPLKLGATAVFRPQDPVDFIYRGLVNGVSSISALGPGAQLVPLFVVGISAAGNAAGTFVEFVTHIEYTVGTGSAGIINTGVGNMNSMDSFSVAKSLFGSIYDTTMQGVVGGISKGAALAGAKVNAAISDSMNRAAGHYFSSSVGSN